MTEESNHCPNVQCLQGRRSLENEYPHFSLLLPQLPSTATIGQKRLEGRAQEKPDNAVHTGQHPSAHSGMEKDGKQILSQSPKMNCYELVKV